MEMVMKAEYGQFQVRPCANEPRLHALYSNTTETGYKYGRVSMASKALETLPTISLVADNLAKKFKLKNGD